MRKKIKTRRNRSGKTTGAKPSAYEQTRARQTGVNVKQLRAEQRDAERMMKQREAESVGEAS